jgi:GT2 family glycosyltransferase
VSGVSEGAPRASIVVATTRDGTRLERCLDALERSTRGLPHQLVLVLSGADDDVREVAAARTTATIVSSDVNLGFAGASNLGRRAASSDAIVLLHDDVEVEDGWLGALLAAAEHHPSAGIIGGRVLRPDGRIQCVGSVMFADGTSSFVGYGAARDDPFVAVERSVDYTTSCCALVRAAAWDAVGGMDEHFFPAGYADADFAFAVRRAGWDVRVAPAAVVSHSGGSTLPEGFKQWVHTRNRERFVDRWRDHLATQQLPGDGGSEAIAHALERARARALRLGRPSTEVAPTDGRAIDPATLPARENALMREYVAELEAGDRRRARELERVRRELDRVHTEHGRRYAEAEAATTEVDKLNRELNDVHARAKQEIDARDAALAAKDVYIESLRAALSPAASGSGRGAR